MRTIATHGLFSIILLVLLAGCGADRNATIAPAIVPSSAVNASFVDVTDSAGIRWKRETGAFGAKWMPETMGGGGGFIDYDGDGWLDIILINGNYWPGHQPSGAAKPRAALYRNLHNGKFADVSASAGLDKPLYGMGVAVGDFDNDGYPDLVITAIPRTRIFHNIPNPKGGRMFADVTESCGIDDHGFPTSAAWVDYDRDGKLDLFVCHYVEWSPAMEKNAFYSLDGVNRSYPRPQAYKGESCRLYRNLGNGRFEDASAKAKILNSRSKALGVVTCDYDSDGLPDIFVANDTEPNFLFHNQGDGVFKEIALESGIAVSGEGAARAGMGIDAADVTGSGSPDILITNFAGEQISLHRRDGVGLFLDVAARSGVGVATQNYLGFGAVFLDYDLDGWQDILLNNGHIQDDVSRRDAGIRHAETPLLFRNIGSGNFENASQQVGAPFSVARVGRGAAWGDFDNDGAPDLLLITNSGPPALLHNVSEKARNWVKIVLSGRESNRDGVGARVRITVGGNTQTQEIKGGGSYLSASDHRLIFGLGIAAKTDKGEIRWPSGKVQPIASLSSGTTAMITEGK